MATARTCSNDPGWSWARGPTWPTPDTLAGLAAAAEVLRREPLVQSSVTGDGVPELVGALRRMVEAARDAEEPDGGFVTLRPTPEGIDVERLDRRHLRGAGPRGPPGRRAVRPHQPRRAGGGPRAAGRASAWTGPWPVPAPATATSVVSADSRSTYDEHPVADLGDGGRRTRRERRGRAMRVVAKIGTSSLTDEHGEHRLRCRSRSLAAEIAAVRAPGPRGHRRVLGGDRRRASRARLGASDRPTRHPHAPGGLRGGPGPPDGGVEPGAGRPRAGRRARCCWRRSTSATGPSTSRPAPRWSACWSWGWCRW